MKKFHSSELQSKPQEPITYIVDRLNPREVIADISRPPEAVKSAVFVTAQKDLNSYGVNEFEKSRLIQLRSSLYHPHSVWFNHSEFDKDAILIAIESLVGEPQKALYPVGFKSGNISKPSDSLNALKCKAQKLLVGYGMHIFLVEALDRLRKEVDNLKSYWRSKRYIGRKLTAADIAKIKQAITDLIGEPKLPRKSKAKAAKVTEGDFDYIKCDPKLKDILTTRFPYTPFCCDDFVANYKRPLAVALKKRNIQINPPEWLSAIVVDVDRRVTDDECAAAGLPPPTWITINPLNGHAHYVWILEIPVWTGSTNQKPANCFNGIKEAYRIAMDGDAGYVGLLTKNPINASWITESKSNYAKYSMDELRELSNLKFSKNLRKNKLRKLKTESPGRNCMLFDEVSACGYEEVHKHEDVESFAFWVQAEADKVNACFPEPLPSSEVRATSKSITRWTWKHRHELVVGGGGGSYAERARACQKRGVEIRVARTQTKRDKALQMLAEGGNIKQAAGFAEVDRKTVERWKKQSERIASESQQAMVLGAEVASAI